MIYDLLNYRDRVNFIADAQPEIMLTNKEVIVTNEESVLQLMEMGNKEKLQSSPLHSSHSIFQIVEWKIIASSSPKRLIFLAFR